jgi:hypothetical protein
MKQARANYLQTETLVDRSLPLDKSKQHLACTYHVGPGLSTDTDCSVYLALSNFQGISAKANHELSLIKR